MKKRLMPPPAVSTKLVMRHIRMRAEGDTEYLLKIIMFSKFVWFSNVLVNN